MNKKKPFSASLSPENIQYIDEEVAKKNKVDSRYKKSHWLDDLVTYLRTKNKPEKEKVKVVNDDIIKPAKVAEIYNREFSGTYARQKQVMTDSLKASIRARSKSDFKDEESWVNLFNAIKMSPFLMGQVQVGDRKPFQISLDWIVKPANLAKILEGTYHEE